MIRTATVLAAALVVGAAGEQSEPPGYRTTDYRTAAPATVNGHAAITTADAERLWKSGQAVFIDTLARPPRPAGLPAGTIWRPKPRADIPGSVWLADTGYGELAPMMEEYFESGLRAATHADRSRRLVFYCLANCWMSWNAAKRATAIGYVNVEWYRDGTDGWTAKSLPLEAREPALRPGE